MKVLMYGWEFPPRISGGLGIACHAIVNELVKKGVGVNLVLPYAIEESVIDNSNLTIWGCEEIARRMTPKEVDHINCEKSDLFAFLTPYPSWGSIEAEDFLAQIKFLFELTDKIAVPYDLKQLVRNPLSSKGRKKISGRYGLNLLTEVLNYALLAGGLAENLEFDVIHAHDWLTILAGVEAKRRTKKPLFFHVHALETDRSGSNIDQRIFAIERYGMEQADKVIAVSNYTKNIIVDQYHIPPGKIEILHNGTDFKSQEQVKRAEDKCFKVVLFLGRVTHQKGPYFFIEVAKKILEYRDDVHFIIAGTGDLLPSMIERVAALRIGKNVHFTGFLDRALVRKIYEISDVYVMPSVSEPFGISSLEALAYQVPAVISKQSGVAEVLKHTFSVDFWDSHEMANKILALLNYRVLRDTMLKNSFEDLTKITWDETVGDLIKLYNQTKGD
jgi:glycogen synthase